MTEASAARPDQAILDFLRASGLVQDIAAARLTPLTGGVSSDIWLVEAERTFCVKRALPQLRVEAEWFVAVERSLYEAAWLKGVADFLPRAVPQLLADDPDAGIFAMAYLDPARHTLWKAELLAGRVDPGTAAEVGRRLGQIHASFACDPLAPQRFATDGIFRAIRIEPYLLATAEVHSDLAPVLRRLAERTMQTARTVVHGDVSPKNLMIGPDGPVFLDAECAWYGDPAFDLAFCLNHLLLKTVAVPSASGPLLAAFGRLAESYFRHVDWEPPAEVEARAASLLPGLLLARIDGKSPVEYIKDDADKDRVRRIARGLLAVLPGTLPAIMSVWERSISDRKS